MKISYYDSGRGFRSELREIMDVAPWQQEPLVAAEYKDNLYDDMFGAALVELSLDGLERNYNSETRRIELQPPKGKAFEVRGRFLVWPDGSDIEWGYGPPAYSLAEWEEDDHYDGFGDKSEPPELEYYRGTKLSLQYNGVEHGRLVDMNRIVEPNSDRENAAVQVVVDGPKTRWHEQARKVIRLAENEDDAVGIFHEYGIPGMVPAFKSTKAEGRVGRIEVAIVDADGAELEDAYLMPEERLWVPEKQRWALYSEFPDLIDQHGDHNNRSNHGNAMMTFGSLMYAMGGRDGNMFTDMADSSNLIVIEDQMVANMDMDKLVQELEELMKELAEVSDPEVYKKERKKHEREAELEELIGSSILAITDHAGTVHEAVGEYSGDDWYKKHVQRESRPF